MAVPLVFCTRLADAVVAPKLAVLCVALALALPQLARRRIELGWVAVLQVALWLTALVSAAVHPAGGALAALAAGAAGLALLGLWRGQDQQDWDRQAGWVAGTALMVALYGWLQRAGLDPVAWSDPHLSQQLTISTLGNPDYLGLYLAACAPLVWQRWVATATRWPVGVLLWLTVVMAGVLTTTRSALLSLALSWLVLGLVRTDPERLRRWAISSLALLGAVGVSVVTQSNQPHGYRIMDRVAGLSGKLDDSSNVRLLLWQGAARIFVDQPWLGCGPTGFGDRFLLYRSNEPVNLRPLGRVPENPHNEYMQELAEEGGPAALALLVQVVFVAVLLARSDVGVEFLACWLGLSLNLVFLCPDLPTEALVVWMVARADGRSGVVLAGPPPRRAFWPIAVLVALGALSWSVQSIVFERQTWLADDDLATRDWLRAGSYYRAALGWAPPWKAASAWSNLGHCLLAAPEHQPQQVAAAVEAYAHSVRLAPTDPYGWANQARALTALQHWKEGVQSWAQAIALDPFNPGFRFEAALLLYQGGALQPALDQVNAALSIYPDTASATNPLAADAARLRAQILRR